RGLARGLGITDPVTSPTYTIVNEYPQGRIPLFHFDMYRLSGPEDLFDIGWEDYLDRGGVCVVEWSENVAGALERPVTVTIEKVPGRDEDRVITVEGGCAHADSGL
ncbi:MAG: tRNA (adenosine(37)-N6)-threonylcarbamoyltransferase complex ATPase subunit type 1 TsaE, partial [Firmicutes bacterium]|nr:tRNA (adenosine(37)-N6)-threonylcarbamoyltransferase complex ATPase subunit type 1 TsaE [Bacillota bacterium]